MVVSKTNFHFIFSFYMTGELHNINKNNTIVKKKKVILKHNKKVNCIKYEMLNIYNTCFTVWPIAVHKVKKIGSYPDEWDTP